jgi:serine/threonine protein kinase
MTQREYGSHHLGTLAGGSPEEREDPRVVRALEEFLAEREAGWEPDRQAFLRRHAAVAEALAECLDGLELLGAAAVPLKASAQANAPADSEQVPGFPLGDYRILREVGRGGMGVVYEAEQLSLGRRVALKVLPFAATLDPQQLARFKHEAQAAGHLHHTNIVPVYAVGCERGVHYYAMQFIDGQTLAALISELGRQAGRGPTTDPEPAGTVTRPLAALSTERSGTGPAFFRAAARLAIQAAEALEHAHQVGVVHRDIKPANLLVDTRGNLWVTDFGLARIQTGAGLTVTGDLVGTLRYMSPERALGKRAPVDHRTDIYSLGVTLYELLTLRPAFDGTSREELLRQVGWEEPRPPRRVNPALPVDLEPLCSKPSPSSRKAAMPRPNNWRRI